MSGLARLAGALGARPRLILLALLATGPLLALLLAGAATDRRQVLAVAGSHVGELARFGAHQEGETVQQLRVLLRVLARDPDIASMNAAACNAEVGAIAAEHRQIQRLFVLRGDGAVACTSLAAAQNGNLADRAWFRSAIAPDAPPFVLLRSAAGRFRGKPVMVGAVPLPPAAPGGRARGVVAAAEDFSWLSDFGARISRGQPHVAIVMDAEDGTILARYPEPAKWVGRRFSGHPLLARFAASPGGGVAAAAGLDAQDLLIGFAPLPNVGAAGPALLAIGVPRGAVLAAAGHRLVLGFALAFAAAAIAFGAAWFVAEFTQLRPLRLLTGCAVRLGTGDLTVRANIPQWHAPEYRVLAATLNEVAENLQRRDRELAAAQADAARTAAELHLLAENSTDIIVRLDADFRRRYVSPACREALGYEPAELVDRSPRDLMHPEDWPVVEKELNRLRAGGICAGCSFRSRRKDGTFVWFEVSIRGLAGDGYVLVTRDISLRKEAEERLAEANRMLELLALQDALTGLANRRRFDDALGGEFRRTMRHGTSLALVLIDVDHFKAYNDLYGHPAGDACLRAVAEAVKRSLQRPGELAARYGGEEIAVLLPGVDQTGAEILAERMRQAVRALDREHAASPLGIVTVSLGAAAISPADGGGTAADLVQAADDALYAAKADGRDRIRSRPVGRPLRPDPEGLMLRLTG